MSFAFIMMALQLIRMVMRWLISWVRRWTLIGINILKYILKVWYSKIMITLSVLERGKCIRS